MFKEKIFLGFLLDSQSSSLCFQLHLVCTHANDAEAVFQRSLLPLELKLVLFVCSFKVSSKTDVNWCMQNILSCVMLQRG